jgi:hypothetical protein
LKFKEDLWSSILDNCTNNKLGARLDLAPLSPVADFPE